uniref:BAR domain-containing protein n=1 Tax=Periophthalmus magnuspinnatus TaxID=409849 RepID=A0A3B4B6S2_9GOBI
MAIAGLFHVSEKVGGAEGTKLDVDFTEMEKVRNATNKYMQVETKFNLSMLKSP